MYIERSGGRAAHTLAQNKHESSLFICTVTLPDTLYWPSGNTGANTGVQSAFDTGVPLARLLRKQLRLFLFYLWFIFGVALSVVNSLFALFEGDTWKDNVEEYLLCVNTNLLYGVLTPDDKSCSPCELGRTHLPFGLILAQLLLNSTLGLVCFILLGFRKDLFVWWIEYWRMAWTKKKFLVNKDMEKARSQAVDSGDSGKRSAARQIAVEASL